MTSTRPKVTIASPSFGTYGGMQAVLLAIAQEVRPTFDVRLLFKLLPGSTVSPDLGRILEASRVPFRFVDPDFRVLVRHYRGSDIVHVHEPSPDLVAAARLAGARVAVSLHQNGIVASPARRVKSRTAMALASAVWFNSDFVGRSWGLDDTDPGVDKAPTVGRLPEGIVDPAQRRGFVIVARLVAGKGHDDLLQAYADAEIDRGAHPLTIVGDGSLAADLQARCEALGIARDVRHAGFLDQDERDQAIRTARWVVAPAKMHEDLGLTPIEGRAVGVPSIVSDDGGLPEAGGPHALVVRSGMPSDLQEALTQAATMSDENYALLANSVAAEFRESFRALGWYADAYRELLAPTRNSRGRCTARGPAPR